MYLHINTLTFKFSHFVPTEGIETILLDGFPSSHPVQKPIYNPYEVEEYYDLVERSKTAAIIRMLQSDFNAFEIKRAMAVINLK